jgi:SAM-dependent methyltransferase
MQMTQRFLRLVSIAFLASCLTPVVANVGTQMGADSIASFAVLVKVLPSLLVAIAVILVVTRLLRRYEQGIDEDARRQAEYLDALPDRFVSLAIFGSAAASLFLELAVIRWQGTVFEFFAFYKNYGLLSCFAGLGLGYALSSRDRIPLSFSIPLLGWQFGLMIGLRFGLAPASIERLREIPVLEQFSMGIGNTRYFGQTFAIYFFLAVFFLLTALAFVPVGQLCGRLMERQPKLQAYGTNLLGSLAGVVLMLGVSYLWMPPVVWFGISFLTLLLFYTRQPAAMKLGAGLLVAALVTLAWPVNPLWNRLYSPYQLLEMQQTDKGHLLLRAAGHYYQRVHDFSSPAVDEDPDLRDIRAYYDLPCKVRGGAKDVAVVGAGTGNDVAAALRCGAGHVDAIEIDPAILEAGKLYHPEHPYDDPRVWGIVNDARTHLRTTDRNYDLIVYGLLDSHTLLSHASSVRVDSFVYTVEALREARAHLKPGGIVSLSFSVMNDGLGSKIYKMMTHAFDGRPPICLRAGYDQAIVFLEGKDGAISLPPNLLQETGFEDITALYANPALRSDISTDDWPFFYMPRRVYPVSYLPMIVLVLLLSTFMTTSFLSHSPRNTDWVFFLLGAGFMLVETKGVTELGLTFGNTWEVIGVVISGILLMAFLANVAVQWLRIRQPWIAYLLLAVSLGVGWHVAKSGGFAPTTGGRIATAVVLTCPLFFSGIVFSTLLERSETISSAMAMNLLGAMCGGLSEYNSMYFGFRSLYWLALIFYVLAFAFSLAMRKGRSPA